VRAEEGAGPRLLPLGDNPMGAAFAAREQVLRESGLGVTYLRPSAFASNTFAWRDSIRAGKVTDPTGDGVLAVMDPEDIARVAVAALIDDGHAGKGYLLTGPQALTAREQVATIAEVTGRSIGFQDVTPHEFAQVAIERERRLSRRSSWNASTRSSAPAAGSTSPTTSRTSLEQPPRPSATGANATPTPSAEARLSTYRQ
jgi:uncharacterized protein YbjT (DUF2867 family)